MRKLKTKMIFNIPIHLKVSLEKKAAQLTSESLGDENVRRYTMSDVIILALNEYLHKENEV